MLTEIIEIRQEAREVKTIRLKLPQKFNFKPGQFIFVYADVAGEEVKRAFSISSAPDNSEYLEFTFNRIPGGKLSPVLYDKKLGDKLKIEGPYGRFICESGTYKNIVFIAGGTGIAPLMCMLRCILKKDNKTNTTIIYSVKTPEDIIFKDELLSLAKEHKNFNFALTITRPEGHEWDGHKGRIDTDFLKQNIKDMKKQVYFICGPRPFIQNMIDLLKKEGVNPDNIKIEPWK